MQYWGITLTPCPSVLTGIYTTVVWFGCQYRGVICQMYTVLRIMQLDCRIF